MPLVKVDRVIQTVADYTVDELEAIERAHPEFGRVEVVDGAFHATGESALGIPHQLIVQRLHLLLAPLCPPGLVVMLDTWWGYLRDDGRKGYIRADVGVYRVEDTPDSGKIYRRPPIVSIEVLSDDALHDLATKDDIYAVHGARRAYVESYGRFGWWFRADGVEHGAEEVTWELDGWPPIVLRRDALLEPVPRGGPDA